MAADKIAIQQKWEASTINVHVYIGKVHEEQRKDEEKIAER